MCGICGFTGVADKIILKSMTDTLIHRGPDEEGFYSDEQVSLGIRRLSIVDLKTGQQPITNEDKSIWTVFNGEIYNFGQLRKKLVQKGHRFYTDHSDTEVIVHLYEELGLDFVHKLNGMFAIALWDKKQAKLFLIRDRMGVKPLFYTLSQGKLIFSSEIKAILIHSDYKREINYEAIYHYFTFKNVPAPLTAFENIYSLLPGEILTFSKGNLSKHKWWKINFQENNNLDEQQIKAEILNLLEDATRLRMNCDVPYGAYLSGGVDSSSIVALMSKFSDKPVRTFSLGYKDELKNKEADILYARQVAQAYKTEHYEYIMGHEELVGDIDKVIEAFDQPFSGTISTFFLTKLIRKHVKVALSGDGADELFGSYLSHRIAQPIYHFAKLHQKFKNGTLTRDEKKLFLSCELEFLEELYEKSQGDEVRWRYSLYLTNDDEKEKLLAPEFIRQIDEVKTVNLIRKYFDNLTAKNPLNRILEMEWKTQFPDQVLAFVDFLSMAHSVEIRSPFLDYRLVELVASLPGNMKIKEGRVKAILKDSVEALLPPGITARPKEGFVLPIFDWMVEKLENYCRDVLSVKRLQKHNLLSIPEVKNIVDAYYAGNKNSAGKVWNLMMFQLWWEKYFG